MKAETAYNVIQALSKREYNRLLRMLGVTKAEKKPKKKSNIPSDAEFKEYFLKNLYNKK
jgi:hypothetical protein